LAGGVVVVVPTVVVVGGGVVVVVVAPVVGAAGTVVGTVVVAGGGTGGLGVVGDGVTTGTRVVDAQLPQRPELFERAAFCATLYAGRRKKGLLNT
jgi:hypothetical protein